MSMVSQVLGSGTGWNVASLNANSPMFSPACRPTTLSKEKWIPPHSCWRHPSRQPQCCPNSGSTRQRWRRTARHPERREELLQQCHPRSGAWRSRRDDWARGDERCPGWIHFGQEVTVEVAGVNGGDRTPELIKILAIEAGDEGTAQTSREGREQLRAF
jgi:hypothetical protein